MLTRDKMYRAFLQKDASFEGIFITAVKTTGIFCRTTCTARKARKENVEFFKTTKEALLHGYRPCKVCSPLGKKGEAPSYIRSVLKLISEAPSMKIKDQHLRSHGIEPNKIRRWFLKNYGITFHAYQRLYRINTAFTKIRRGEKVSSVAFDSGYGSLSGFADSFKTIFGVSPSNSKTKQMITLTRLEGPLGPMMACATDKGICLLEFSDRKMPETEFKDLGKQLHTTIVQGEHRHFEKLRKELDEYFVHKRKEFSVPLDMLGSPFQQAVWQELLRIPYGSVRSYKEQAIALKKPEAIRAIASANGMNRIAVIIPCHRVIGSNGTMVGYGGGIWRKKWLLDHEQQLPKLDL